MKGKGKGWYGKRQQHSMASKGVRSGKMKQFGAKGVAIQDPYNFPDFDINEHYWGLSKDGDSFDLRLGNWSDAGWYWSGDESDFAGYLIRITVSSIDDFEDILERYGLDFNDFKEMIIESAKSGNGVYQITGDNVKWHFGQDGEREDEILDYDLQQNESLTDKELEEFKEYYWMQSGSESTDYDVFEKSDYYKDLVEEIVSAVENADSWSDIVDRLEGAKEVGEEASWDYSQNAITEDIYENFNKWNKTDRWNKEVESGLPNDETIENLLRNFGRVGTMNKIKENYWDVETLDEAKKLVKQYEGDAIKKGKRPIEKEQKRMGDF